MILLKRQKENIPKGRRNSSTGTNADTFDFNTFADSSSEDEEEGLYTYDNPVTSSGGVTSGGETSGARHGDTKRPSGKSSPIRIKAAVETPRGGERSVPETRQAKRTSSNKKHSVAHINSISHVTHPELQNSNISDTDVLDPSLVNHNSQNSRHQISQFPSLPALNPTRPNGNNRLQLQPLTQSLQTLNEHEAVGRHEEGTRGSDKEEEEDEEGKKQKRKNESRRGSWLSALVKRKSKTRTQSIDAVRRRHSTVDGDSGKGDKKARGLGMFQPFARLFARRGSEANVARVFTVADTTGNAFFQEEIAHSPTPSPPGSGTLSRSKGDTGSQLSIPHISLLRRASTNDHDLALLRRASTNDHDQALLRRASTNDHDLALLRRASTNDHDLALLRSFGSSSQSPYPSRSPSPLVRLSAGHLFSVEEDGVSITSSMTSLSLGSLSDSCESGGSTPQLTGDVTRDRSSGEGQTERSKAHLPPLRAVKSEAGFASEGHHRSGHLSDEDRRAHPHHRCVRPLTSSRCQSASSCNLYQRDEVEGPHGKLFTAWLFNRIGRKGALANVTHVNHVYKGTVLITDMLGGKIVFAARSGRSAKVFATEQGAEPWCACITPKGHVAVTLRRLACVTVWSGHGSLVREFGNDFLQCPTGLACDRQGRFIVTDERSNRVAVFSPTGEFLHYLNDCKPYEFNLPRYVCVTMSGKVVVSDSGSHSVKVFSPDGVYLHSIGSYGSGDGQLKVPYGVCSDQQENIYIADHYNDRVSVFSVGGVFLQHALTSLSGLSRPKSVAVRPAHARKLYIAHGGLRATEVLVYRLVSGRENVAFKCDL
ncbi:uncharacterized protein [Littorina saxatilis]|uniref:uncharacterized protein n=1 Tax=Littorina saxatilis TaxID=31220 RepID=UPI0038B663C3